MAITVNSLKSLLLLIIPAYLRRGHSLTNFNAAPSAMSKWLLGGPKMADRVWKDVYPLVLAAHINFC